MRITQHDEKPPERLPILEGVRSYLQGILAKATKVALERVRTNQPLTAYGVDSVMRATINQQISKDFPDISKTLMFEYETLDEIANYLYRNQEKNCQKLVSVTVVNRDKSLLSKETAGTQNPSIDLTVENITSEKRLPLSIMQSQLYSTYLADPCSAEYNMGVAVRFRGPYKPVIFRKALKLILNRHEALRMSINTEGNQWEVTVSPQVEIDLPLFSLEEEPSPVIREQRLNALIEKYKDQPINLSQSPLMRVFLVQLDKEEYVFIAVFHHIIMDGWSLSVFTKDLSHYCQMLLHESKNHQALPPAYQYSTYLLQQSQLREEEKAATLNFWQKQFLTPPDVLQFPIDTPRSSKTNIQEIQLTTSVELTANLQKLANQQHVTLFNCLFSAYQVLLSLYSGASEIVVGVPYLGRDNYDMRDGLGLFIHTVPLRATFKDNPTFIDVIKSNHALIEAARKHQSFSLPALLRELKIERLPHTPPLFQVLFNLIRFTDENLELNDSQSEVIWTESGRPAYDLNLEIVVEKEQLKLTLKYDASLFSKVTATHITQHFLRLLQEICKQPNTVVSNFSLLTESEKYQLLTEWNQTKKNYSENKTLHQLFTEQVDRTPEHIAVYFGDQKLTYKELNIRVNQVAHFLQNLGVLPDEVVAISMERSLDLVIGLLAILKAGGAYLPLDTDYPSERLQFMLQDSKVKILMTHSNLQHLFSDYSGNIVKINEIDAVLNEQPHFNPTSSTTPDNLIYLIYTSGSTGVPKGVENTHRSLVNRIEWMQHEYQLTPNDKVLQKTPMSFDVSVWEFFWPLLSGSQLVIATPQIHKDALELAQTIQQHGITVLHFVPSMLSIFLLVDLTFVQTLRMVFVSGEVLPADLARKFLTRFKSTQLHNLYGPTEAAIDVSYWHCKELDNLSSIPIGRPIANTQLYVLNQNLQPVPIGVIGELYIGGVGVARGYRNRRDLTSEKFLRNPFATEADKLGQQNLILYRTGDSARYLPDGNIEYVGRLDQQVKLRGLRIELEEIEYHLRKVLKVNHAAVILYEDENRHKKLVAYILSQEMDKQLNQANIKQLLKQNLTEYMIPEHIIEIDEWPLSPSGKINKKQLFLLTQMKLAQKTPPFLAPPLKQRDGRNQTLIAEMQVIVGEILKRGATEIDPTVNFGDLGFDSIRFSELSLRVNKKYGFSVSPQVFYRYKNLEQLAEHFVQTYSEQLPVALKES
ncbi:MAG: amino acid adenylation domain-containing protein, partial [Proteobacteria bacterium]|nr:amino acid adenylation domain-containing protein [Pseudomonadota bacterium]